MIHKSDLLFIALAQLNQTVGDVEGNAARIVDTAEAAREKGCRLVVFPELSIAGYPPEDLLLRRKFIDTVDREMARIVRSVPDR
jgi:NAD+ synthase (glutamine-hydrolysing)